MKRTVSIHHDKLRKLWWVVDVDGWWIECFRTPREARHFKRMWHLYMTTDTGFHYLDIPCPPKRVQCPCCEEMVLNVRRWRTNTQFVDDSLNYATCCYDCICENDLMRHHDWADYYSSAYGYYQRREFIPRSRKDYIK